MIGGSWKNYSSLWDTQRIVPWPKIVFSKCPGKNNDCWGKKEVIFEFFKIKYKVRYKVLGQPSFNGVWSIYKYAFLSQIAHDFNNIFVFIILPRLFA